MHVQKLRFIHGLVWSAFLPLILLSVLAGIGVVTASNESASIVISEVMWMGSDLSTADEWVEMAVVGPPGDAIDLSGWQLTSALTKGETTIARFSTGTVVPVGRYFLVSNYTGMQSRLAVVPDLVATAMSLPNTKLLLRIRDRSGIVRDEVDDGVGEPFAGANPSGGGPKASMERIDLLAPGTAIGNWRTSTISRGFRDGVLLFGTPGSTNGLVPSSSSSSSFTFSTFSTPFISSTFSTSSTSSVAPIESSSFSSETEIPAHASSSEQSSSALSSLSSPSSLAENTSSVESTSSNEYEELISSSSIDDSSDSSASSDVFLDSSVSSLSPDTSVSSDASAISSSFPSSTSSAFSTCSSSPPVQPLLITEILANPLGSDTNEWIEIGNTGTEIRDIAGLRIDIGSGAHVFDIPRDRTTDNAFPPRSLSGFLLLPGEYVSFRKTVSHLTLANAGDRVRLLSGSTVLDTFDYPSALEGISVGRKDGDPTVLRNFCLPTEGAGNEWMPGDPQMLVQETNGTRDASGALIGIGHVSLNLIAEVMTGSLASAHCHFDYGDGHTSDSCNPASHSIALPGDFSVRLSVAMACDATVERTLRVRVLSSTDAVGGTSPLVSADDTSPPCVPRSFTGVVLSEFMPNPRGDDAVGEWIELANTSDETVSLCGWAIDKGEGSKTVFRLDRERLFPKGFLSFSRSETGLALRNDSDHLRLLLPGDHPVQDVIYDRAVEDQSMALRDDGQWVWTPYLSPGGPNQFLSTARRYVTGRVIVSAALPNPAGKDKDAEWIELLNVSDAPENLDGWVIDTGDGHPPFSLQGVVLQPMELRRFTGKETTLTLRNTRGTARLLDPDGYITSVIGWDEAAEDAIVRPPHLNSGRIPVRVSRVIDGDTFDIVLEDLPPEKWRLLPKPVQRRWIGLRDAGIFSLRVRLIGIDAPELHHPTIPVQRFASESANYLRGLIEGKKVELEFEETLFDHYDRLLAYAFLPPPETDSVEELLLRQGLARAYTVFPSVRKFAYVTLQDEAKRARLGLWSDADASQLMTEEPGEETTLGEFLASHDFSVRADPAPGLVASGTMITLTTTIPSQLFVSINSGSYLPSSGSVRVPVDLSLQAFAEVSVPVNGSGLIVRSSLLEATYVIRRDHYDPSVVISEVMAASSPASITSSLDERTLSISLPQGEWIELHNLADHPVSLAYWTLDDQRDSGSTPFIFPAGTQLSPGEYRIVSGLDTGLKLNDTGDAVMLLSPDGVVADSMTYPHARSGVSWNRVMSGTGAVWCQSEPTPLRENHCRDTRTLTGTHVQSRASNRVFSFVALGTDYRWDPVSLPETSLPALLQASLVSKPSPDPIESTVPLQTEMTLLGVLGIGGMALLVVRRRLL